jgi:antirestriction protein ArdC
MVTDRIMAKLQAGTIPWKHFASSPLSGPKNLISKKPYHGINHLLLTGSKYGSPYWLTYRQAEELGGHVKKGEKAELVVFWKWLDVAERQEDGTTEQKQVPFLRHYHVFNVEQTQGVKHPALEPTPERESHPIEAADAIVNGMPHRPDIIFHDAPKAYYSSQHDEVWVTRREKCVSDGQHYETLLHELVHSTGHKSRLNRFEEENNTHKFGSKTYAQEELVAEMGAGFLCAECGIFQEVEDNTASYIANWLTRLENDKTLVVKAARKAQKAVNFITGTEEQKGES